MRLGPLITVLAILAPFSAAEQQDTSCGTVPGQEAVPHAVGNFTIPNGSTPSFSAGTSMNISWDTTFQLSTLWLITGCDFADPTKSLVVGTSLTYFIWDVETTSTNTSELYSFRVVDSDGSTSDQESGGFWSAVFYIDQTTTTTSSSISSTSTSTSSISSATSAAATTTGGSSATTGELTFPV
ncbi:hypothetical protein BX600DRAFT_158023 [Xylariales sp. PMI_506]|nr:hypothetical protein BX600DRAFT_158023 [Xylariales sp. PMI_506]